MSKDKDNENCGNQHTANIELATAILNLIVAILLLIETLIQ